MNPCTIDHLVITAPTLEAGSMLVEESLGVSLQKGGEHPKMGTHNLLLHLGGTVYLEVIACNPVAERPDRPRWFALDDVSEDTPARLRTWVARTENIYTILDACSESPGEVEAMSRGENRWLITIPENGKLPVNQGVPAIIQWQSQTHPASKLTDCGLSLVKLKIYSPETERISAYINSIALSGDVELVKSSRSKIVALIDTPNGIQELH